MSAGILEAIACGRILTTSAMSTSRCWARSAREIAPFLGRVELGLHLNLTQGEPLSKAPGLAPSGRFAGPGRLLLGAVGGTLPHAEVRTEIARQIDAFETAIGRPPDFVDGHWHVHLLPGVRTQLFAELRQRGLAGRVWLRDSSDRWRRIAGRGIHRRKAALVAALGRGFRAEAARRGFLTNDGFAGFSSFDPGRDYARDFSRFLALRGPRHLVMCHPGHVDDELRAFDHATASRERELAFLLSDAFLDQLAARELRLAKLSSIGAGSGEPAAERPKTAGPSA